ncbi:NAD(P)-binding protein [Aspergillus egyptiacus]|nr:NAD(P)-binding protein [Aspergillus egyptiacus]
MPLYNTYPHFLYRQFFIYPSKAPSSLTLQGRAGLITGSNTGLGYHAASQLLSLGLTRLILAVRNISKGEAARQQLLESLAKSSSSEVPVVEIWELDMANYASIVGFVERLKQSSITLDFVILNAGVANFKYELSKPTGNEENIQINWLGTAEAAAWAKFEEAQITKKQNLTLLQTLNTEQYFDMPDRYYTSKLLYQLFFLELVNTHRSSTLRFSGAVLNLVNPGFCYGSELHRSLEGVLGKVFGGVKRVAGRSVSMGARTLVHAAVVVGADSNGKYLSDNRSAPFAGYGDSSAGRDTQRGVWDETITELSKVIDTTKLLSEI